MKALTVAQPWASLIVAGIKTNPAFARMWAKVEVRESGCWEFMGSRQKAGHGLVKVGSRTDGSDRTVKAHRLAYETLVRPLGAEEALDHLCSNPPCVNPDHLDPCTRGENARREADRRTHCRQGHPWVPENIRTFRDGRRTCRTCLNARRRARRAKGKA